MLWRLRLPSALPYDIAGIALIGAGVRGGHRRDGILAWRIESGYRLNIPSMFAALS